MAAAMCDAIVGIHQVVVATIRVGSVSGMVPVWLVGGVEVELAHLGKVALRRVVDEQGLASIERGEIIEVLVGVF
jgi:hypothetical protein